MDTPVKFSILNRRGEWTNQETITAGAARDLLANATRNGVSRVNRSLTKVQALKILEDSIADKADDQPIHPLIARNITRETQQPGARRPLVADRTTTEPIEHWPSAEDLWKRAAGLDRRSEDPC